MPLIKLALPSLRIFLSHNAKVVAFKAVRFCVKICEANTQKTHSFKCLLDLIDKIVDRFALTIYPYSLDIPVLIFEVLLKLAIPSIAIKKDITT